MLVWFSLFLISFSWILLLPVYSYSDITTGLILLLVGIAIFLFENRAVWKSTSKISNPVLLLIFILLFIPCTIIPFPYSIGAFALLFSVILLTLSKNIKKHPSITTKIENVAQSLVVISSLLLVQALMISFYIEYGSKNHYIFSNISVIPYFLLKLIGIPVSISQNGVIYIQALSNVYPFVLTTEKLGMFFIVPFISSSLVYLIIFSGNRRRLKTLTLFFAVFVVYVILRYTFLTLVYVNDPFVLPYLRCFFDVKWIFLSFLPMPFMLGLFIRQQKIQSQKGIFTFLITTKRDVKRAFILILAIFLLTFSLTFYDPGAKKRGRILFDELHSEWENVTEPFYKKWYGMMSTYNYYSLYKWLGYYYDVDMNLNKTLSYDMLKNYDILVIKCPTKPFSDQEVKSIVRFVKNGGGLYLIGDHTNVFGMNYYLNQISRHFGIIFNFDETYFYPILKFSEYKPDKLLRHPIMYHTDKFLFLTSCTLTTSFNSHNVITGYRLFSEPGTYTERVFFRRLRQSPDEEVGFFVQAVSVNYGKGRVVAFTDSTCFSNFCIFMDGYPNFNLAVFDYLNRENSEGFIKSLSFIIGISLLIWISITVVKEKKNLLSILFTFVFIGLVVFSISSYATVKLNEANYPLPKPKIPYLKVCFVTGISDRFFVDPQHIEKYSPDIVYNTFFIRTQVEFENRSYIPSIEKDIDNAISKGDVVVLINPTKKFDSRSLERIDKFLQNGGNLILMDSVLNTNSTSNYLLRNYGIFLEKVYHIQNLTMENNISSSEIPKISYPKLVIKGDSSTNKMFDDFNETQIAYKDIGEGRLIVVVDSYTFSNEVMGGAFAVPSEDLAGIYETEYYIFEKLIKLKD